MYTYKNTRKAKIRDLNENTFYYNNIYNTKATNYKHCIKQDANYGPTNDNWKVRQNFCFVGQLPSSLQILNEHLYGNIPHFPSLKANMKIWRPDQILTSHSVKW